VVVFSTVVEKFSTSDNWMVYRLAFEISDQSKVTFLVASFSCTAGSTARTSKVTASSA